jgi:primosomal protein N' (replication factor Y)
VVLQTYRPEHYAIAAASKHDYAQFYEQEIGFRRDLGYPPFRRIVRIVFRAANETKVGDVAEQAAKLLRYRLEKLEMTGTDLIGPAPCFFTRVNREFRWHLLLIGPEPTVALRGIDIPHDWAIDVDPVSVL